MGGAAGIEKAGLTFIGIVTVVFIIINCITAYLFYKRGSKVGLIVSITLWLPLFVFRLLLLAEIATYNRYSDIIYKILIGLSSVYLVLYFLLRRLIEQFSTLFFRYFFTTLIITFLIVEMVYWLLMAIQSEQDILIWLIPVLNIAVLCYFFMNYLKVLSSTGTELGLVATIRLAFLLGLSLHIAANFWRVSEFMFVSITGGLKMELGYILSTVLNNSGLSLLWYMLCYILMGVGSYFYLKYRASLTDI